MPGLIFVINFFKGRSPAHCGSRESGSDGLVGEYWWVKYWNMIIWYNRSLGIMSNNCVLSMRYFLLFWDVGREQ